MNNPQRRRFEVYVESHEDGTVTVISDGLLVARAKRSPVTTPAVGALLIAHLLDELGKYSEQ